MSTNGYRPVGRAQDVAVAFAALLALSPLLALPVGLAWRVGRWAAGA